MNRLLHWLGATTRTNRKTSPQPPRARPALEELESRRLLSVSYHGGPLLQNVEVEAVYYGPAWQTDLALEQQAQQLDQFLSYITNSPYMDMLGEYGVGRGQFLDQDFPASGPQAGDTIQSGDIVQMLVSEISQGGLQPPDANRVYFVFLPPGVTVGDEAEFAGFHQGSGDTPYGDFAYAVVMQASGPATLDALTATASHELTEAVTDPVGGGWYDDSLPSQGEIGDLCDGQDGTLHGYVVQKEWSNQYQTGILPMPANLYQAAYGFTHSDEYFSNLIANDYLQFLGRSPSAAEIANWVNAMDQGATDEQVLAGFLSSPEYYLNAGGTPQAWVDRLYADVLGRTPDAAGEAHWLGILASGQSPWAVAYGFAISDEHEELVLANDYQQYLGRSAGSDELAGWLSDVRQGMTQEDVVAAMVASPESFYYDAGSANDAWITNAYETILNRDPDDAGFQFWLSYLDSGE